MSSIIVKMEGGLGNQLLQYLFGLSLASIHKKPVYFDITEYFSNRGIRKFALFELNLPGSFISCIKQFNTHRENVHLKKITFHQRMDEHPIINTLKLDVINEKNIQFSRDNLTINCGYFAGYWQSYKYWDNVTETLTWLNNILDLVAIQKNLQVDASDRSAIHVRRGDYLHTDHINWHGVCEEDFYLRAIHILDSNTNVFFTDDSTYVDYHYSDIRGFKNISRELNNEIDEFLTIRTFQKIVISNSSYSYMAAMLASFRQDDCSVVAPYPWYSWTEGGPDFLPEWIKLNRVTGQNEFQEKAEEELANITVIVHFKTNASSVDCILDMLGKQTLKPNQIFFVGKGLKDYPPDLIETTKLKYSSIRVYFFPDLDETKILFNITQHITGHYVAFLNEKEIWHEEKLRLNAQQAIRLSADVVLDSIYRLLPGGSYFITEIYENIDSSKTLINRCIINFLLGEVSIFMTKTIILKILSQIFNFPITDQKIIFELAITNAKKITNDHRLIWMQNTDLILENINLSNTNNAQILEWMLLDNRVSDEVLFNFYDRVSVEVQSKFSLINKLFIHNSNNVTSNFIFFLKSIKSLIFKFLNFFKIKDK